MERLRDRAEAEENSEALSPEVFPLNIGADWKDCFGGTKRRNRLLYHRIRLTDKRRR